MPWLHINAMLHVQWAPPVFSTLNGRLGSTSNQGVTVVVVREGGLFDPGETFAVQHSQALWLWL